MTIDIYGIEWYRLGNTQQQIVVFMLHRAQTAKDLSVGGIAPLNVETYVKVRINQANSGPAFEKIQLHLTHIQTKNCFFFFRS